MNSLVQEMTEGDCWLIHPRPGYVIKFKEAQIQELEGPVSRKCFVNLCHSVEVPSPIEDLDQDTLAQRIDAGDFSFRVPISIGEVGCVMDNKKDNCLKIDVLINTVFFERRLDIPKSEFYRHFITLVLCDAIEQKHAIKIEANDAIILTNRRQVGELDVMKLLKKPDNHYINAVEEQNMETNDGLALQEPLLEPRWEGITVKIFKNCKIEIKMALNKVDPPVEDPARLRLQVGSNRVVLLLDNQRSLYDFCIPFVMEYNVARRMQFSNSFSAIAKHANYAHTIAKFVSIVGMSNVITNDSSKRQYMKDEGHFEGLMPEVVVLPESIGQVSEVLKMCNLYKIPVIPFGTGTGLEGGVVHMKSGVTLALSNLEGGITNLSPEDGIASVRPSITRGVLNSVIKQHGLFFPVDPGADASVCGMAATGASGTNAIRYGTMKENVLNLQVVLADGTIINTRGRNNYPPKTSAGYNLTELFVGSEGSLGVITEATVKLHCLPSNVCVAVSSFENVHDAVQAAMEVTQSGIPVAKIEFMDDVLVAASNKYSNLALAELPTLFLEFHGITEDSARSQLECTKSLCMSNNAVAFEESGSKKDINHFWKARHDAYYAALSLRKGSRGFTTDVCVPISKLADVITSTKNDLVSSNILGAIVGHVGDGNFHVILPINGSSEENVKIRSFSDRLVKRALFHNGSCTGEHGIGMGKLHYLGEEVGQECLSVMRRIKESLDPNNIMNPGKVLE